MRLRLPAAANGLPAADSLLIESASHHLRTGQTREWSRFPIDAEGARWQTNFAATRNRRPGTILIRQSDVRLTWKVSLNGKEIGRLPRDENDMLSYYEVPADTLRDIDNELVIQGSGDVPDDIEVGPLRWFVSSPELSVRYSVRSPDWIHADRVRLCQNGVKIHDVKITPGSDRDGTFMLPRPDQDVFLTVLASGPGILHPSWPIARPYQPDGPDWTATVFGFTGAIRVDADGDGKFSSAQDLAGKLMEKADGDALLRSAKRDSPATFRRGERARSREPKGIEAISIRGAPWRSRRPHANT